MKIITNNHQRPIIDDWELTSAEQAEFDYYNWEEIKAGNDSAAFFRYKGRLYDLGEFERSWIEGWDGIQTDSMFSAVIVRLDPCGEYVVVGTVYS
jgi:hypothetical protein